MSENPDVIRADIEATRARLGTNVDAVADKVTPSHIVQRQTDKVKDAVFGVKEKVMGAADHTAGNVHSAGAHLSDAGAAIGDAPAAERLDAWLGLHLDYLTAPEHQAMMTAATRPDTAGSIGHVCSATAPPRKATTLGMAEMNSM